MQKHLAFASLVAVLVVIVFYFFRGNVEEDNLTIQSIAEETITDTVESNFEGVLSVTEQQEALQESSLFGTQVSRAHVYLENGELVLSGHVLFYFDYFLSLEGEMLFEKILALIKSDMHQFYGDEIAVLLFDVFMRYVEYRKAMAVISQSEDGEFDHDKLARLDEIKYETRLKYFTEKEIAQLFDDFEKLLAEESQARQFQQDYDVFYAQVERNPEQLEAMATELFGEEAAQRLVDVRVKKQQWQDRLKAYQCEKEGILNNAGLDEYAQARGVQLLLERSFSEPERRRVLSVEQAGLMESC